MKYDDLTKLENKIISLIHYKIIYINSLNHEKVTFITINSWLAICQYIHLKLHRRRCYNVQIFKRGKDISQKVDKILKKLNKKVEKLWGKYETINNN